MKKLALPTVAAILLGLAHVEAIAAESFYYRYPSPSDGTPTRAPPESNGNGGASPTLSLNAHGVPMAPSSGDAATGGFSATGGTPPYTFVATEGLPDGIDLNPDGSLTGSFARPGDYTLRATVSDAKSASSTVSLAIQVRPAAPVISLSAPALAVAGMPFSAIATQVQGGILGYSLPVQPGWLAVGADGRISGTVPAQSPGFAFEVLGSDLFGRSDRRSSGTVTVAQPSASFVGPAPRLIEGDQLSGRLTTNLPGATWAKLAGPPWIMVSPAGDVTGQSGDVPPGPDASVTFSARAVSGSVSADATGLVAVAPATVSLAAAQVRSGLSFSLPLSTTMAAAGSYAATSAPADITGLAAGQSTLTGTAPSVSQSTTRTVNVTRTASSGGATATGTAVLTVLPRVTFTAQPQNVTGTTGTAVSSTKPAWSGLAGPTRTVLSQSGSDIGAKFPTLCPGLGFDDVTGQIAGTPSAACSLAGLNLVTSDAAGTPAADTATSNGFSLTVSVMPPAPAGNGCATVRDLYVNGTFDRTMSDCNQQVYVTGVSSFTVDLRQAMRLSIFDVGGSVWNDLSGVWEYGDGTTWTAFAKQAQYGARTAAYDSSIVTNVPLVTARYVRWRYTGGTRTGYFFGLSPLCRTKSDNSGPC